MEWRLISRDTILYLSYYYPSAAVSRQCSSLLAMPDTSQLPIRLAWYWTSSSLGEHLPESGESDLIRLESILELDLRQRDCCKCEVYWGMPDGDGYS